MNRGQQWALYESVTCDPGVAVELEQVRGAIRAESVSTGQISWLRGDE